MQKFSDRSRKVTKKGTRFIVPHKFTPEGDVINHDNFNPRRDLSKLSLDDFLLLEALQEKKWDFDAACQSISVDSDKARRRYKTLSYFNFEEKRSLALAAIANPTFVTAQNVKGYFEDNLSDGQRDHLKELAKITGAYKPTTNLNLNVSAFVKPQLSPEEEVKTREFFDAIAIQGFPT